MGRAGRGLHGENIRRRKLLAGRSTRAGAAPKTARIKP